MNEQKRTELQQLIKRRFPSLRLGPPNLSAAPQIFPTGWGKLDVPLGGGLPCGTITEVVAPTPSSGGVLLQISLLRRAWRARRSIALVDSADAFDPNSVSAELLSQLLWIRCRTAAEAMKCADVLARDGNVPLVLLDLVLTPTDQLRRITPNTWFRLQRLIEGTNRALLVMTPIPFVGSAQARVKLHARFDLESLLVPQDELLGGVELEWLRIPNQHRSQVETLNKVG